MTTVERVYALTRIEAGEYLLPSNDGKRLFRIRHAHEERWSEDDRPEPAGKFWQVWIYDLRLPLTDFQADRLADSMDSWEDWELVESWHKTRAEAVQTALGCST